MRKIFKSRRPVNTQKSKANKDSKDKVSFKQKVNNKTASWNLVKLTKYFLVLAVLIGLVTSYFWYTQVYMSPERRFWSAINNSMATPSVVRTLTQGGSGNEVIQDFRFNFAPQRVVENRVQFSQKSATVDTFVVTEGVIFPDEQFLRYSAFKNESQGKQVANIDGILGQWASEKSANSDEANINYLSEQVTLAIFGNFTPNQRNSFMKELKENNVYGNSISSASEDTVDGEQVLSYAVSVDLKEYARILNQSFVAAGYGEFPALNPENYREGSAVNSSFVIRKRDNALIGINFGDRQESYSSYGVISPVKAPESSISIDELQNKVQALIQ